MRLRPLLAFAVVALVCGTSTATPRQESAEATVRAFLTSIASGDVATAARLISGAKSVENPAGLPSLIQQTSLTVKAVRSYGNEMETVVVVDLEQKVGEVTAAITDTFRLRKEGETWKILASPLNNFTAPPSIAAMMLVDSSIFTQAKTAAKKTICLSNMKQVALGTMMYTADHDDRLPNASKWRSEVMQYVKNTGIFRCPEDKSGTASSYRMNPALSRIDTTKVAEPASTVLIYEGDGDGFNARHAGTGSVAFADGHAKLVSQSVYKTLRQNP